MILRRKGKRSMKQKKEQKGKDDDVMVIGAGGVGGACNGNRSRRWST